ncbi:MAG: hypothetical protein COV52_07310 [Gammaproteobacteria bacterium CG11_big_fil_rev_8_21_14_0_20_46_22]|nr:MAG: hypothetical protein COW05_00325 [Gammaproteobacteria bacterium CG12_big_fil_rev_8_21_14_0_65_46_12]PIR10842.1 MAG: hypothetical protein COV52_07310 [Gammaproteobacteria bacterium CG11_big_fil_rev_8_21_14_0_20_46_22]
MTNPSTNAINAVKSNIEKLLNEFQTLSKQIELQDGIEGYIARIEAITEEYKSFKTDILTIRLRAGLLDKHSTKLSEDYRQLSAIESAVLAVNCELKLKLYSLSIQMILDKLNDLKDEDKAELEALLTIVKTTSTSDLMNAYKNNAGIEKLNAFTARLRRAKDKAVDYFLAKNHEITIKTANLRRRFENPNENINASLALHKELTALEQNRLGLRLWRDDNRHRGSNLVRQASITRASLIVFTLKNQESIINSVNNTLQKILLSLIHSHLKNTANRKSIPESQRACIYNELSELFIRLKSKDTPPAIQRHKNTTDMYNEINDCRRMQEIIIQASLLEPDTLDIYKDLLNDLLKAMQDILTEIYKNTASETLVNAFNLIAYWARELYTLYFEIRHQEAPATLTTAPSDRPQSPCSFESSLENSNDDDDIAQDTQQQQAQQPPPPQVARATVTTQRSILAELSAVATQQARLIQATQASTVAVANANTANNRPILTALFPRQDNLRPPTGRNSTEIPRHYTFPKGEAARVARVLFSQSHAQAQHMPRIGWARPASDLEGTEENPTRRQRLDNPETTPEQAVPETPPSAAAPQSPQTPRRGL